MSAPPGIGPSVFTISGPLPTGTTVLEASAGTGKTWAIAALVARYVAEGTPLHELLVVTFGRAATEELRERVRERLIRTEEFLRARLDGGALEREPDRLERTLIGEFEPAPFPRDEIALRHRRIRDALGAFDDATIATIHQFCHTVLRSLGVAGDTDPGTTLVEDLTDLRTEVVDDLYLARYRAADRIPFSRKEAGEIAETVTADPAALIGPVDAADDSLDAECVAFGQAVRTELDRRKRTLGILSYDDLLRDLAVALEPSDSPARARMQQRWSVVLVDEFQDTDPIQWLVFERAFHGHSTLVLIGDPKQAIYAFRGGDIDTYLRARSLADQQQTLATNRRSDAPLVQALSAGLSGMALGNADVVISTVDASHTDSRLAGLPVSAPWRLRVADRTPFGVEPNQLAKVDVARPLIAADCAADIARVLASGATFDGRPLQAGDIAVLCATNVQLQQVHSALAAIGIPAVLAGDESVLRSPAARWWLMLLEAMEMPNRSRRVRTAAVTPFFGHDLAELDERGDELTDAVAARLRRWAELFALRGIPAVVAAADAGGLAERLLTGPGGERRSTDVRHLSELLHQNATADKLGLSALTAWLRRRLAEDAERPSGQRSRRLESDAAAVQLATVHASKGLQFPIVYAPFLGDRFVSSLTEPPRKNSGRRTVLRYHDAHGQRVVDISNDPAQDARARARAEDDGESLRLLYVALTRAQSQLVTWWAPLTTTPASPLHRALLGRDPKGVGEPEPEIPVPTDRLVAERLGAWMHVGGPQLEVMTTQAPVTASHAPAIPQALAARTFDRYLDEHWRRTSYSALTRASDALPPAAGGSEPELPGKDDEAPSAELLPATLSLDDAGSGAAELAAAARVPSPMATLPVGNVFGSLVHAVLEVADPLAPDLRAELRRRIAEQLVNWPVELSQAQLADALELVCRSPLGPLAPGATLADIGPRDRLCELEFELPLAGGDRGGRGRDIRLAELAPLLRTHLPEGDPLLGFADALSDPLLGDQQLRGYLTGSVDVVLRVSGRYLIVDYKTNWLGPPDAQLTAATYGPAALAAAMQHSSYPLQALLYAVVLHRFLRWRLPAYEPDQHFGGVLYLYLRGMCGPDTPIIDGQPTGVFSWQPPIRLVMEISALLDGASE